METHTRLDTSYRGLLKVALPMSFGALVQFVLNFTDNYFVARISGEAMSAVAYVGLIYVTLAMIGYGLANAAQILVARRKGEQDHDGVSAVMGNAMWIALLTACIQFSTLFFAVPMAIERFIASAEIRNHMNEFIPLRAVGFAFSTMLTMMLSFWSGIAITRVMAYTTLITAAFNIVLDYLLIFGHGGFPEMGIRGAALATALAEASALIYLVFYTLRHPASKPYRIGRAFLALRLDHTAKIFSLGGPIVLQLVLSLGIWVVFYNFVEKLGEASFQSAFIVRNMYMLAWVSVMGTGTTAKTYVSGLIAEGRQRALNGTVKKLIVLNLAGIVILTHGLLIYPGFIASLFTDDPLTIAFTIKSAWVVLPAIMVFGVTSILLATVEGSGNTLAGFVIELITSVFYISTAWYLAIETSRPVYVVWMADYVYFILIGVFSVLFLRRGTWKTTTI